MLLYQKTVVWYRLVEPTPSSHYKATHHGYEHLGVSCNFKRCFIYVQTWIQESYEDDFVGPYSLVIV